MSLATRIQKLESVCRIEGEIGLAEYLEYLHSGTHDPQLEAAFNRSTLGRLVAAIPRVPRLDVATAIANPREGHV
jgi:hypothetical protein